jgi:Flp pilus assembly protein TadD
LKHDLDGAIAEQREVLRLEPNDSPAHFLIGLLLEEKHDQRGALEEYRAAYTLDPKNPKYEKAYEKLARKAK